MSKLREIFKKESSYLPFLISVAAFGLSYGMYKGAIDNYMAEIVGAGEFQRGVTEFFRELPGLLLVFVLAVFYNFTAETIYKLGTVFLFIGIAMHAIVPPQITIVIISIFVMSFGEHLQLGMKSILPLQYAQLGKSGQALGLQSSSDNFGKLLGYIVIAIYFMFADSSEKSYKLLFMISALLMLITVIAAFKIKGSSKQANPSSRFYFKKKFIKYYMLEVFYGARKQVFLTFGPYVLILFYGASASVISLLFAVSAIACLIAAPLVGKIIDRVGYKIVMIMDTVILVVVCLAYGFAHHIFSMHTAFIICCVNYVLDAVISLASMASNVYVHDLSDSEEETKATISTGISVNHTITILIALFGGWVWETVGIETLFIISAVLGLCNSAYAATIKTPKKEQLTQ